MIVFVDSNVWVSAFLNPKGLPATLLNIWKTAQAFQNVCSMRVLEEVSTTLFEPRVFNKYNLDAVEINKYLELLAARSSLVAAPGKMKFCRDPHDDHVLEAALIAKAEHVVTRDDDMKRDIALLNLFSSYGIQITSVRQFLQILSAKGYER